MDKRNEYSRWIYKEKKNDSKHGKTSKTNFEVTKNPSCQNAE